MEFQIGDKVKKFKCSGAYNEVVVGSIGTFRGIYGEKGTDRNYCAVEWDNPTWKTYDCGEKCDATKGTWVMREDLELLPLSSDSNLSNIMEKKVFKVFVMDTKTEKTKVNKEVIANDREQALLKAFDVDTDNSFIKVDEIGNKTKVY